MQLADAIGLMASRVDLRVTYGNNAQMRAQEFEYQHVAAERYKYLLDLLSNHRHPTDSR